jgi:hypothetical protein
MCYLSVGGADRAYFDSGPPGLPRGDPMKREFIRLVGGAARALQGERVRRNRRAYAAPQDNSVRPPRIAALLQELELLGWTACRNVEIDVRLAARDGRRQE